MDSGIRDRNGLLSAFDGINQSVENFLTVGAFVPIYSKKKLVYVMAIAARSCLFS